MKSLTEYLWFEVPGRRGFLNITPKVEELVSESGVREGLCLVNAMHITASVSLTTTRAASTTIMKCGSKNSRRTRQRAPTGTTGPAKTTPTRT
jgi:uncharacterized protein UPF0047